MRQKKALNGSHLEVFLSPQRSTEHDFDLSISNLFLTLVQLLQDIKKKQKRGYAFKFQICLKAFLENFHLKIINLLRFLYYLLGRNKSSPCFCLLTFFDKQISSVW